MDQCLVSYQDEAELGLVRLGKDSAKAKAVELGKAEELAPEPAVGPCEPGWVVLAHQRHSVAALAVQAEEEVPVGG